MNWLRRIFQGPGVVELSIEEHPLFGIDTPAGIEAIIEWKYIFIDDCQETSKRVAFLTCYPPWEANMEEKSPFAMESRRE